MARRAEEEAEWDDEGWQRDESVGGSDEEDEPTIPCPYCRREIHEGLYFSHQNSNQGSKIAGNHARPPDIRFPFYSLLKELTYTEDQGEK